MIRTLSKVVMAYVATLLFASVIKFSMSMLQPATALGCDMASLFSVLIAANLRTGFGDERKSCSTAVDAVGVRFLREPNQLSTHPQPVGRAG
jgi:hypothetical protein